MERAFREKRVYKGIDLFKLIASILVVILHAVETSEWYSNEVKFVITSFAVPFFFIASGFFFYIGIYGAPDKKTYFIKYENNLLKIFVVWALIIYMPFEVITYIEKYPDAGVFKLCLYLIRRVFIIGPGPYWYIIALMWSVAFLYLCYIKDKDWYIYIGIVVGLILEILYSCFQGLLGNIFVFRCFFHIIYIIFSWENNFIMLGIPFMGIGYFIAKNKFTLKMKTSAIILLVSTMFRIIEYNLPILISSDFWKNNQISVNFIIQAIAFFMLAKDINLNIKNETSLCLRQFSSCIYYSHVIFLYELIDPLLGIFTDLPIYSGIYIFPKIVMTLSLCCLLFFIVKKINNRHLNILING